jgi:hypothetical protein
VAVRGGHRSTGDGEGFSERY